MFRIVLGFVAGWVIGAAVPRYLGAPDLLVRIAAVAGLMLAVVVLLPRRMSRSVGPAQRAS